MDARSQGKYLEAFSKALGSQNLDLVMQLCDSLDASLIFRTNPLPLTQPVILSLISQLSSNMEDKLSLKLFWLMEAVAKIDTRDEQTGRFVPT